MFLFATSAPQGGGLFDLLILLTVSAVLAFIAHNQAVIRGYHRQKNKIAAGVFLTFFLVIVLLSV